IPAPIEPERPTQLARAVGRMLFEAQNGLGTPQQYGARMTGVFSHDVQAPVHPVDEVDVGAPAGLVHRRGAARAPVPGVRRPIVLAEVRLRLDEAGYQVGPRTVPANQESTEEVASDEAGIAVIERGRKREKTRVGRDQRPERLWRCCAARLT